MHTAAPVALDASSRSCRTTPDADTAPYSVHHPQKRTSMLAACADSQRIVTSEHRPHHQLSCPQDGGGDSSDDETMTLDDLEAAKAAAAAAAAAAASTSAAAATPPLPPRRGSRSHRDTPQPTQAAERGALGEGSKAGRDREGEDDDDELQFEFEAAATPVAPAGLGAGGGGGVRGAGPGPISGGEEELPGVEGASSGDEEEEEEEGGPASRYRRAGRDAALGSNNSSSDEEEEVADLDGRSVDSVSVGSAKLASGLAAAFASAVAVSGGRRPSGGDAGSLSSSLKAAAGVPARPVRTASRNSGGGGGGGGGDSASSTPLHGTSPAVGGLLGTSFGAAGVTPSGARSWLYGSSPVMGASPFFRTGLAPSGGGGGASGGGVLGGAHNAWVARAASSATRKHSRGLMSINVSGGYVVPARQASLQDRARHMLPLRCPAVQPGARGGRRPARNTALPARLPVEFCPQWPPSTVRTRTARMPT